MNGIHDLGGMDGFGPVTCEKDEPVFHAAWEKNMFGIALTIPFSVPFRDDHLRREIERIPPADYLKISYYELWFRSISSLLIERDVFTLRDLEARVTNPAPALRPNALASGVVMAADAQAAALAGASTRAEKAEIKQELLIGDLVRVNTNSPQHHTRVPRYVRGRIGRVIIDHGVFGFPDTNSQYSGECPQHCYSVEFSGKELWGSDAEEGTSTTVDLWESYMEKV
jgi:nitrile hydratase subunit beta